MSLWVARKRGGPFIELEDLLEALIREDQGQYPVASSEMLPGSPYMEELVSERQSFFPPEIAGRLLAALEGRSQGPAVTSYGDMPLSRPMKLALESAMRIAEGEIAATVEPLHLLAAIVEVRVNRLAQLLKENGITRQKVARALRSPGQT